MSIQTLHDLADSKKASCLIFKVGSALLVGSEGVPRRDWLATLTKEIAEAHRRGQRPVVVSSGAIALGAARLGLDKGGRGSLADAQAAASVGQIALAELWSDLLGQEGLVAAQLLLTLEDLEDRRRYLNASATIERLLDAGAVPIINENDSVATQEIRFGDNDRLAARVAQAARADAVVLLSDVDGLYDGDPAREGTALVPEVRGVDDRIFAMAHGGSGSGMGSGGMTSKLQAAQIAERAGIALAIINGTPDRPFAYALQTDRGTLFLPKRNDGARKSWLGGRLRMKGVLRVDDGCVKALAKGASLLAPGIVAVSGTFQRGDPVTVEDASGRAIAKGLAEYTADEVLRIMGHHTDYHETLLGYAPRAAVIHRDQMVWL